MGKKNENDIVFTEEDLVNDDIVFTEEDLIDNKEIPTVSLTEEEATSGLQTEPEGVSTLKDTYKKGAELNSRVLLGTYDQRPQQEVFELQETLRPEYKQERKFTEQQLKDIAIQTNFSYPERLRNSFIQGLSPFISEASRNIGIMAKKIEDELPKVNITRGLFTDDKGNVQFNEKKSEDYATYQFADWLDKTVKDYAPTDSDMQKSIAGQLTQGAGSLAGFVLAARTGRALNLGKLGSAGLTAATGAAINGGMEYKQAKEMTEDANTLGEQEFVIKYGGDEKLYQTYVDLQGKDPDKVGYDVFQGAALIGSAEALPVASFFRRLDKFTGGAGKKYIGNSIGKLVDNIESNRLGRMALGGVEEGAQEAISQYLTNANANEIYDKSREYLDGVFESGNIGGILGLTLNAFIGGGRKAARLNPDKADEINAAVEHAEKLASKLNGVDDEAFYKAEESPKVVKLKEEQQDLTADISSLPQEQKSIVENRIEEINREIEESKKEEIASEKNDAVKEAKIKNLEGTIASLDKGIEGASDATKKVFESQKNKLVEQLNAIKNEKQEKTEGSRQDVLTPSQENAGVEQSTPVVEQAKGEEVGSGVEKLLSKDGKIKGENRKELNVKHIQEGQTKKILITDNDGSTVHLVPLKSDGTMSDYVRDGLTYLEETNKQPLPTQEAKAEQPTVSDNPALANVEATAKALDNKINITREKGGFVGDFLNDYELIGEGSEHTVYRSKDGSHVIRISEPYNDKSESTLNARINDAMLISEIIGDGSLEVIGYYESQNGTKNPIYRQKFQEGTPISEQEAVSYLQSIGAIEYGDKYNRGYLINHNGKWYKISDLTDNFFRNKDGEINAIDAAIQEISQKEISEAYHKAKKDGSNPELVKAVEQSIKAQPKTEAGSVGVGGDVEMKDFAFSNFSRGSVPYEKSEIAGKLKNNERSEDINVLGYHEFEDLLNKVNKTKPKDIVGQHLFDKPNAVVVNENGDVVVKLIDKNTGKVGDKVFYKFKSLEDAVETLHSIKENHRFLQLLTLARMEAKGKETELTKYANPTVVKKTLEKLGIEVPQSIKDKISEQSLKKQPKAETPKAETPKAEAPSIAKNPVLESVEATAKALEGVDIEDFINNKYPQGLTGTRFYRDAQEQFTALKGLTNEQLFNEEKRPDSLKTQEQRVKFNQEFQKWTQKNKTKIISEAYHKAKADGSNPKLVKAVEQSIQNKSVPQSLTDVKSGIFAYGKNNSKTTERIQYLVSNEGTLSKPESQELQRLRGERDNYISELDKQLQSISDRYGEQTDPESFNREDRQQWELLQRELQVVGQSRTKLEQENYDKGRIQGGNGNATTTTTNIGNKAQKVVGKDIREENDGGTSGSNATNEEGKESENITKQSLKETTKAESTKNETKPTTEKPVNTNQKINGGRTDERITEISKEPTQEVGGGTKTDTGAGDIKTEAGKTKAPSLKKADELKTKLKEAKDKAKEIRSTSGVAEDPFKKAKKQAQADREVLDAYVNLAKHYISEGIKTIEEFAKELGSDIDDAIKNAWKVANGEGKTEDFVKEPEVKERAFAKQIINAEDLRTDVREGLSEDAKNYIPKTNELSQKEALAIIEAKGEQETLDMIKDLNNGMKPSVRVFIGENLIKRYNKTDIKKAVETAEFLSEYATELGQGVQAFQPFSALTPEGQLLYVQKEVKRIREKQIEKAQPKIDRAAAEMRGANKEAIAEVLNVVDENISKAKDGTLAKKSVRAKQKKDLISALRKEYFQTLNDASRIAQLAVDKRTIQLAKLVLEDVADDFKAFSKQIMSALGKEIFPHLKSIYLDAGGKKAIGDVDKEVARAIKELDIDVKELVTKHYTEYDAAKKSLTDKLVKDAGMTQEDAEVLSKQIQDEFEKVADKKKKQLLKRKLQNKVVNKKRNQELYEKLIELSNLGAFSDKEFTKAYAEKAGFANITEEQAKKIIDLANKIQEAPEGMQKFRATEDLLKYQENIKGVNWGEVAQSVWYANVLSGYSTQVVNTVANIYNTATLLGVASVKNPFRTPILAKALVNGWVRGIYDAADVLKTGYSPIRGKVEIPNILERVSFKGGKFNPYNYAKYVQRIMNAADTFAYEGLKEMRAYEMAAQEARKKGMSTISKETWQYVNEKMFNTKERIEDARAQAKDEGFTGIDYKRRVFEILEQSRPPEMVEDSKHYAARGTFNYQPEGTIGLATNWVNQLTDAVEIKGVRPLKFIVPFTRIIGNVTNNALDYTPYGFGRAAKGSIGIEGYSKRSKTAYRKFTPEQQREAIIKASLGTVMMAALYALTQPDDEGKSEVEITGAGTGDFKKDYELKQTGWQPYSLRIGDTWYSYKETPFVLSLSLLGNYRDNIKYKGASEEDALDSFAYSASSTANLLSDMTFLGSATDFVSSLSSGDANKLGTYLKTKGRSTLKGFVVPNLYTQAAKEVEIANNQALKDPKTTVEYLMQDIPVARNSQNDKINSLGEPVLPDTDRLTSEREKDPVWNYIVENRAWIGKPNQKASFIVDGDIERPMNDDEYYEFIKLSGKYIREGVEELMKEDLEKSEIKKAVNRIKENSRRLAKEELFSKNIN